MYMIMIFNNDSPDPGLVPYTGAVYNTKAEVLPEYLEASEECGHSNTYLVIV